MNSRRISRMAGWLFLAIFISLLFPLSRASAQGGQLQPLNGSPLYGNFCTAVEGVSLHNAPHSAQFNLNVPGSPVKAAWMWSGRSEKVPYLGDDTISVTANGSTSTLTAPQSLSELDGGRTWHTYLYDDAALATVQRGNNSYSVSGLSINTINESNHGAAIVVVYEDASCPYQRVDLDWGLDAFRNNPLAQPDSDLVCKTFPAAATDRTLTFDVIVGGTENDTRGNAIWTITGNGTMPSGDITPNSANNPYPSATQIDDALNGNRGDEFDIYSLPLAVPAGDTYACFQIESKQTNEDPYGVSAVVLGTVAAWPMEAPTIDIQKSPDLQTVVSGSAVTFTLRIENSGPVALTDVIVSDPQAPDCNVTLGTMAPSDVKTHSCSLAAVTAGFTNVASVTGTPPFGSDVSDQDDAVVEVINPAIDIQKTPDMQTVEAGSPVTFTISVKNTGDITLTNVSVTDALTPDCDINLGTMAPEATQSTSCVLDAAAQSFINVATVTGLPPVGPVVNDSDDAEVVVINPAISITKSPDTQTIEKGDSVSFSITVENVGDVALSNVTVTDAQTPACDNVIGTLAVNGSETYQCSLDAATESFTNVAKVTGETSIGANVSDEDDADVIVIGPAIDIQKSPDMQKVPSGSDVTFDITVTNIGDVALSNVAVTDAIAPACDNVIGELAVGDSSSYSCTMPNVTDNLTNIAKVTGQSPLGTIVADENSAAVETANIEIQKTPDTQTVASGSDGTFMIKVINTGNVVLTNVTVTDALAPQCDVTVGTLQPGASHSYACTMGAVNQSLVNNASVTGDLPSGVKVMDDDSAIVDVIHPSIIISKTPDLQTVLAGSTVDFNIWVMNNGDVDLTDVAVTDPHVPACDHVIGELAIGATAEYSCQLDAATTDFTNVAMVNGTPPVGANVTDQDEADVDVISPALSIEKLPDMQVVRVDGTAHFTIVVRNTGNTPLFEVAVTDALSADCNRTLGDLRPGDSRMYLCEAPNVAADFVNVADVAGKTVLDTPLTDSDNAVVDVINPAIDITKTATNENISLGETAEFTIRVENSGDTTLNNVVVADQIAPECSRELGTLHVGDIREYTCEMSNVRETITNVATVTGQPPLGADVRDEDQATVDVPKARMVVNKEDDEDVVQPGALIHYTLTYANEGAGDAFDVVLIEIVPAYTTFDAANSTPGWDCEEGRITAGAACRYEVGDMPAGTVGEPLRFVVKIDAVVPKGVDTILNQVTVDGINLSPAGGSNIATEETPMAATSLDTVDEPGLFSEASSRFNNFLYVPLMQ